MLFRSVSQSRYAAYAILVLGGLGFLGLGLPEEVPEWGHDLKEALADLSTGIWWTTLFPGLAMTTMVVGLSLLGEGLSEIFRRCQIERCSESAPELKLRC